MLTAQQARRRMALVSLTRCSTIDLDNAREIWNALDTRVERLEETLRLILEGAECNYAAELALAAISEV